MVVVVVGALTMIVSLIPATSVATREGRAGVRPAANTNMTETVAANSPATSRTPERDRIRTPYA